MTDEFGVPVVTADAAPYWDAAGRGKLALQRCRACARLQFPPSFLCRICHNSDTAWIEASGRAEVHSFTVVHRAPNAAWRKRAPYVLALVELAEGPRLMTNIVGAAALTVAIGDPVEVEFEQRGSMQLPMFRRMINADG